jgi:hypothetical protein
MTRTFTENPLAEGTREEGREEGEEEEANVAVPYNILSDGTPFRIPFSEVSGDTMMFSAISVRASMADLLKLYTAFLNGAENLDMDPEEATTATASTYVGVGFQAPLQSSTPKTSPDPKDTMAETAVLKQVPHLFRPYISRTSPSSSSSSPLLPLPL